MIPVSMLQAIISREAKEIHLGLQLALTQIKNHRMSTICLREYTLVALKASS